MNEEQNTEALKKARTFSDNKDKIDGFYNGYVQATIELEKENAELKDDNKIMADNYSKMEQKFYDNLTKAKHIIIEFVSLMTHPRTALDTKTVMQKAEQFISEVEK